MLNQNQPILYISGRAIKRAFEGYRGEGTTHAKYVAVIAGEIRVRRDPHSLCAGDEPVIDLKILTGRRVDVVVDARAPSTGSVPTSPTSSSAWNASWAPPTPDRSSCCGYRTPATIPAHVSAIAARHGRVFCGCDRIGMRIIRCLCSQGKGGESPYRRRRLMEKCILECGANTPS
ncbi:hypothetical protein [Streptomyces sp. NBC_01727]|uniref:hypothetical protein n=1 Tax=Streptomyces sp. NBC_01727 TaxID=2975924 RepID=UPI002E129433|nr:hypothetical protein OIE76_42280 [Streptomyces sp. NBC_01727]